jgi:anion-transporting  ArsA/GET3 family ATPase
MALDTLATLSQRGVYDLIVLDTPPVQQALDFLEAPQKLQRFLDSRISKWLMHPSLERGWATLSFANRTTGLLLKKVEEATGISTLGEIAEFFSTMRGMFEDFGPRFERVSDLLSSEETAFVLVASPEEEILQEAERFHVGLERLGISLQGIVITRVHEQRGDFDKEFDVKNLTKRVRKILGSSLQGTERKWMIENFVAHQTLARIEQQRLQRFFLQIPTSIPIVQVPFLPGSLADLGKLASLHCHLFSQEHQNSL